MKGDGLKLHQGSFSWILVKIPSPKGQESQTLEGTVQKSGVIKPGGITRYVGMLLRGVVEWQTWQCQVNGQNQ